MQPSPLRNPTPFTGVGGRNDRAAPQGDRAQARRGAKYTYEMK